MRSVIVLGSTGSIGTQTLDVIRASDSEFKVVGICAAGGRDVLAFSAAVRRRGSGRRIGVRRARRETPRGTPPL